MFETIHQCITNICVNNPGGPTQQEMMLADWRVAQTTLTAIIALQDFRIMHIYRFNGVNECTACKDALNEVEIETQQNINNPDGIYLICFTHYQRE